jgi:hypothetical protein
MEFNGMLWGQRINVYTDHKNLARDGLGLTSDRVTRWKILLEEYAPEIIYKKGSTIQSQMQFLILIMIIGMVQAWVAHFVTPLKC